MTINYQNSPSKYYHLLNITKKWAQLEWQDNPPRSDILTNHPNLLTKLSRYHDLRYFIEFLSLSTNYIFGSTDFETEDELDLILKDFEQWSSNLPILNDPKPRLFVYPCLFIVAENAVEIEEEIEEDDLKYIAHWLEFETIKNQPISVELGDGLVTADLVEEISYIAAILYELGYKLYFPWGDEFTEISQTYFRFRLSELDIEMLTYCQGTYYLFSRYIFNSKIDNSRFKNSVYMTGFSDDERKEIIKNTFNERRLISETLRNNMLHMDELAQIQGCLIELSYPIENDYYNSTFDDYNDDYNNSENNYAEDENNINYPNEDVNEDDNEDSSSLNNDTLITLKIPTSKDISNEDFFFNFQDKKTVQGFEDLVEIESYTSPEEECFRKIDAQIMSFSADVFRLAELLNKDRGYLIRKDFSPYQFNEKAFIFNSLKLANKSVNRSFSENSYDPLSETRSTVIINEYLNNHAKFGTLTDDEKRLDKYLTYAKYSKIDLTGKTERDLDFLVSVNTTSNKMSEKQEIRKEEQRRAEQIENEKKERDREETKKLLEDLNAHAKEAEKKEAERKKKEKKETDKKGPFGWLAPVRRILFGDNVDKKLKELAEEKPVKKGTKDSKSKKKEKEQKKIKGIAVGSNQFVFYNDIKELEMIQKKLLPRDFFDDFGELVDKPKYDPRAALSIYGTDITELASLGKLDEAYGRDQELIDMMEILVRRQKNNPVLVGDAGVGKTAVIEMFAIKMVNNLVPFILTGRSIISIDLSRVVAGTRYRGEFESRLQRILDEILSQPHIMMFIDEIHNISGAGSAEGSLDAANILKPVLSRSGFQCIGASTPKEYEKIEKDQALNRRFQPIKINEPSVVETIDILFNLRPTLEAYHNVEIMATALEEAAELSHRFIYDRFLPDKAIDLVDRAGAAMVIDTTRVRDGSVVRALVTASLRKLGLLRMEAFRRGDVATEFIFQEIDTAYRNFILHWVEEPRSIPTGPSDFVSPLSQSLYDQMQLTVLTRVDELLFASPRPRSTIRRKRKMADLSDLKNNEIYINLFREKPTLNFYRICLLLFGRLQEKKIEERPMKRFFKKQGQDIEDGLMLKEDLMNVSAKQINIVLWQMRDIVSETEPYTHELDFFANDVEKIDNSFELLSELEEVQIDVVKDFLKKLKPLIKRNVVRTLSEEPGIKIKKKDLKAIYSLLGYYSTDTGRRYLADLEAPEIIQKARDLNDFRILKRRLRPEEIRDLISKMTGVPLKGLTNDEAEKLQNLEATFRKRVIGQDQAIGAISKAIRRSRLGIQNPNRPLASFLFCGPTGVGKTEVTKVLASTMFGSERDLIRFDMSEFMEKFAISRLIGSPPGYIGYEEGGQLTDAVRRKPYSVVLFDEIEKAHPDILNILLQILEDGRLTDSQKRLVKFDNSILILTSNAAADEIQQLILAESRSLTESEGEEETKTDDNKIKTEEEEETLLLNEPYLETLRFLRSPIRDNFLSDLREELQIEFQKSFKDGPPKIISNTIPLTKEELKQQKEENKKKENAKFKDAVFDALRSLFLPEFLNRLDDIIIFRPLGVEDLRRICDIMIEELRIRVQEKNVILTVSDSVRDKLSREGYNPFFGARPLRRLITKNIEDLVSDTMLVSTFDQNGEVKMHVIIDAEENIKIEK